MSESIYSNWVGDEISTLNDLLKNCPWFDEENHFLVAIEDDGGNCVEIVGCGSTIRNSKPALRAAFKRSKKLGFKNSVALLRGMRLVSFVI